ncbi:serine protease [Spongiactinospora gelatinilytica]|uniref:Serine protease n=1 Tax=Spongiactinospora gelatinilytica TaxID=2666298 RepID=A0A2W2H259_9ACTN|nr:S8 family serine peptidase [Spongiactinospora gelatinilytica]PZG54542.1 serine protease [Spongiactinospora gelatinilytica]
MNLSVTTISLATAVASTALIGQAPAAATGATPPTEITAAPRSYDVTLITGDRVHVTESAGGRSAATVTPARRGNSLPSGFRIQQRDGDTYVYPNDMLGLIPDRLDPELFNVTTLAEEGLTDAGPAAIPLILTYAKNAGNAAKAAVPQLTTLRTLESIGGAGVTLDKTKAAGFGGALLKLAASGRTKAATPLDGVRKIWLDRKARSTLDRSTHQIGAPAAWAAGFDGAGTTVAVLDSGVDAGHPDLAGRIAGQRDFTGIGTGDQYGHGTHVAAILGGSGQGSAGARKGVAPGARLLDGRVLDGGGMGFASWVIDGMEWAAGEQDADVVNLSLGFAEPGGPVTEAVGDLTRRYGTLFVVAAGNSGCQACVGSPGDAPEALTVGAVDREDGSAGFSSFGPVGMQRAVKPDVTAPGVGIVAARARGTGLGEPVDATYTRISGTSMATPHVAGAAALLRQVRPGITAAELKSLLMGTAKPAAGISVDKQGTGRIDVAGALAQPVQASSGSVDFGLVVTPEGEPVTRTVSYRNPSATPVTLDLTAGGAFSVVPARLDLPAGGTGSATVTLDPGEAEAGWQRIELVAKTAGGPALRTLLTANAEPKRAELNVKAFARDGRETKPVVNIVNVEDGGLDGRALPGDPVQWCDEGQLPGSCVRVLPGTYSVLGRVITVHPSLDPLEEGIRGSVLHTTFAGDPEVEVTGDTEVVLDARKAVEIEIDTPHPDAQPLPEGATKLIWHRKPVKGADVVDAYLPAGSLEERFFATPTESVTKGEFGFASRWRLAAPQIALRTPGVELDPRYYDAVWFSDESTQFPRLDGEADLTAVDAGRARPEDLAGKDLRGRLALVRRDPSATVAAQSNAAAAAGAKLVAIYSDTPGLDGVFPGSGTKLTVPTVRLTHEEGLELLERMREGPVVVHTTGVVASPYAYEVYEREEGRIPAELKYTVAPEGAATVETTYRTQLTDKLVLSETRFGWQPWEVGSYDSWHPQYAPRTRVDYVTADTGLSWEATAVAPERYYNVIWQPPDLSRISLSEFTNRPLKPGEVTKLDWFRQPLAPGVRRYDQLRRTGDLLYVDMQAYVDAHGNTGTVGTGRFPGATTTDFRLYQGDTLVAQTEGVPAGTIALPPEPAGYRIEYDVRTPGSYAKLSTRTKAVWTFGSQRPQGEETAVVPLLLAGYDVPVDIQNRSGVDEFGLRLYHQRGSEAAEIKDVSLEVSYDDGATWRPVDRLQGKGGGLYDVSVGRPGGEFVSLRLKATDQRGNSLSQEVIRAYARR